MRTPPTSPDSGRRETVTIEDGDRQISVSSPDGQGKVTVTVDDGSGTPKTYELDFGEAADTGRAEPTPGEPRPMPLPTSQLPGGPGPGGGSEPFLTEQSPGGPPGHAGPDGVAVIQDGDLTITAEHPSGSPDQIVVTVDDGVKDPTTYTLDYSDPVNPTSTETPGRPVPSEPLDIPGPVQATTAQAAYAPEAGAGTGFGQAGSVGAPDAGQYADATSSGGSGEAGLAEAPDSPSQSSTTHGTGAPMLPGMGAGAGGAGDDQDRSGSQWRTSGDLFDDVHQYHQPEAWLRGAFGVRTGDVNEESR